MKRLILAWLAMMVLAGCGDTVYQSAAPTNSKLVITDTAFSLYSSIGFIDSGGIITRSYAAKGVVGYSGDPAGAKLTMTSQHFSYHPDLMLSAGNKLVFFYQLNYASDIVPLFGGTFQCVLTDPHGNDSNTFPMTLQ